jgi:hypothetical protein
MTIGFPTCYACDKPGEWLITSKETGHMEHACKEHKAQAGAPRQTDLREHAKR